METNLKIGKEICKRFSKISINSHITAYNKFNNSLYIHLGDLNNPYNGIRISDHQGKLIERYSLRSDLKQSEKITHKNKQFFIYCFNDLNGMITKIIKEQ